MFPAVVRKKFILGKLRQLLCKSQVVDSTRSHAGQIRAILSHG